MLSVLAPGREPAGGDAQVLPWSLRCFAEKRKRPIQSRPESIANVIPRPVRAVRILRVRGEGAGVVCTSGPAQPSIAPGGRLGENMARRNRFTELGLAHAADHEPRLSEGGGPEADHRGDPAPSEAHARFAIHR